MPIADRSGADQAYQRADLYLALAQLDEGDREVNLGDPHVRRLLRVKPEWKPWRRRRESLRQMLMEAHDNAVLAAWLYGSLRDRKEYNRARKLGDEIADYLAKKCNIPPEGKSSDHWKPLVRQIKMVRENPDESLIGQETILDAFDDTIIRLMLVEHSMGIGPLPRGATQREVPKDDRSRFMGALTVHGMAWAIIVGVPEGWKVEEDGEVVADEEILEEMYEVSDLILHGLCRPAYEEELPKEENPARGKKRRKQKPRESKRAAFRRMMRL